MSQSLWLRRGALAGSLALVGACGDNSAFLDTGYAYDADTGDTAIDVTVTDTARADTRSDAAPSDVPMSDTGSTDASRTDASVDAVSADAAPSDVATTETGIVDGGSVDATVTDTATPIDAGGTDAAVAYRHTIVIDGVNDFAAADQFTTTSSAYTAYASWDATSLYVGYDGSDVASGDTNKWVMVYIDVDPGAGSGATTGQLYNTEQPTFPTGFGAEYYFRWKASNTFQDVQQWTGSAWATLGGATPLLRAFQSGTYVEFALPLSAIGTPSRVGIVSFMLNEMSSAEAAYAGLYSGSFVDGYHPTIPVSQYLSADFSLASSPNDPSRER